MGINQLSYRSGQPFFQLLCCLYYFFRKKYVKKICLLYIVLARGDERNKSVPIFATFTAKCIILFTDASDAFACFSFTPTILENESHLLENRLYLSLIHLQRCNVQMNNSDSLFEQHKDKMLQLVEQLSGKPLTLNHNWK